MNTNQTQHNQFQSTPDLINRENVTAIGKLAIGLLVSIHSRFN
jgi:hypothetical protein